MSPRRIALAAATALVVTPLAALTGNDNTDTSTLWGHICSFTDTLGSAILTGRAASTLPVATCNAQPSTYQTLGSVGGTGDTSVSLKIGYDPSSARLCFASTGLPDAPVLRVGVGHSLSIQVTNTLQDTGAKSTINCPIATFGGESACAPASVLPEAPGADGSFYPIMANEALTAHGDANLHVHGLFVSPAACSDEVIGSDILPANWGGPSLKLLPCQSAPNTLNYTYALPVNHPAGVYWYHTHIHGVSEQETQMGLAGAIVVEDAGDANRAAIGVTDEVLLVTDHPRPGLGRPARQANAAAARASAVQALASANASAITSATARATPGVTLDPRIDQADQAGECASGASDSRGGTETWTLRLNGAEVAESSTGFPTDLAVLSKTMQPGQRQIFRLVNAATDSYVAPELVQEQNGVLTTLPLEVFARDGVGLADAQGNRHFTNFDVASKPFIVPPASRVEFVVHAPPVGATLYLQSAEVDPGCGGNRYPARRMLRISAAGTPVNPGSADDSDLLAGEPSLAPYLSTLPDQASVHRTFVLSEYTREFTYGLTKWTAKAPTASQFDPEATDFFITEVASDDGEVNPSATAVKPFVHGTAAPQVTVHLHGAQSVTEEWQIVNSTLEIHDFHMHQIHFRDITTASTNPDLQPILDAINVPAAPLVGDVATGGPGAPGAVTVRMTFTKADIGEFVFHCHILEHEDNGMMGKVVVVAD